jgi:hypothetical protein
MSGEGGGGIGGLQQIQVIKMKVSPEFCMLLTDCHHFTAFLLCSPLLLILPDASHIFKPQFFPGCVRIWGRLSLIDLAYNG